MQNRDNGATVVIKQSLAFSHMSCAPVYVWPAALCIFTGAPQGTIAADISNTQPVCMREEGQVR